MNLASQFTAEARRLIYRNGSLHSFTSTGSAVYDVETGSSSNSSTSVEALAFTKRILANTNNYPNLIGKHLKEFLVVADDLSFIPKPQDKITRQSSADVYIVNTVSEQEAGGKTIIYKIVAVKD